MKSTGRAASRGYPALSLVPANAALADATRASTTVRSAAPPSEPAPDDGGPIRRIVVDHDGRLAFVAVTDIQCIEARGDLIVVHTAHHSHLVRSTLQAMYARLGGGTFLRIHRSILVNGDAIAQMQRTPRGDFVLTLANGQRYASSASHRQALLEYIRRCRP